MKVLAACSRFIDGVNEWTGRAVAWFTTLLVVWVCVGVFLRYVLNYAAIWMDELQWHFFSLIFLLGAAYTLKHDAHVRVDLWYAKRSAKTKAWINLLGSLLFLIPFCCFAVWESVDYTVWSFRDHEVSAHPGGLGMRWLIKAAMPVGFFLLLLQGVSLAIRSFLAIAGHAPEEKD